MRFPETVWYFATSLWWGAACAANRGPATAVRGKNRAGEGDDKVYEVTR